MNQEIILSLFVTIIFIIFKIFENKFLNKSVENEENLDNINNYKIIIKDGIIVFFVTLLASYILDKIDIDNFNLSSLINLGNNNIISEPKHTVGAFTNDPGF